MGDFFADFKHYWLDTLPLSIGRVLPAAAAILFLHELAAVQHVSSIFVHLLPFDANLTSVVVWNSCIIVAAIFFWRLAEFLFDQERTAHREAFEEIAPAQAAQIEQLTGQLAEERARSTTLTRELETERKQHETQKTTSQSALAQLAKTQAELEKTQAKLNSTENELFEALQNVIEANEQREEAESLAANSQNIALQQAINELDHVQDSLTEYQNQLKAKLQKSLNYGVVEAAQAATPVSAKPPASVAVNGNNSGPKTNYLN